MQAPSALPPDGAVPVESPIIRRLYATQEWADMEALLAEDFVWHADGKRRRAKHLKSSNQWAEAAFADLRADVETIVADLEHPTVLFVQDTTRGRARHRDRPDLEVRAWTRVVLAPCGTRVRELGPSAVIDG